MTDTAAGAPALPADPAPGVYRQDVDPPPPPVLLTGVPVFLGYADPGPDEGPGRAAVGEPRWLTSWPQFRAQFGASPPGGYLAGAVRGFFDNGGFACYVARLDESTWPDGALDGLRDGLAAVRDLDGADLVCAPDVMRGSSGVGEPDVDAVTALQAEVLADCRLTGGRFAVLDAVLTGDQATVEAQRAALSGEDGALYHPWPLVVPPGGGRLGYVPPCGHVAGVYARCDQRVGVHKAPANEPVEGVLDLRADLDDAAVGRLTAASVNCLRALPGRGIRVWGARTLSDQVEWRHVSARRVFVTVGRWAERFMARLAHEPNDLRLRVRVERELTAYLDELFRRGALDGRQPQEAFFVKCDDETNPPEVVDAGMVVVRVGLALAAPTEFVVVRIVHGPGGVAIQPGAAAA